ncbi:hypothetical protein GIB67_026284, partial [Kingdonia uniflora]
SAKEENRSKKSLAWYQPLYEAAVAGDWESARRFLDIDSDTLTADISTVLMTALQVAIREGHSTPFVENLVDLMPIEALQLKNPESPIDETALGYAAIVGNVKAAEIILRKYPGMANTPDDYKRKPIYLAARYGHRDTLLYFLCHTEDSLFTGKLGVNVVKYSIKAGFYDVAIHLLERYPNLATYYEMPDTGSPLYVLAELPWIFPSGTRFRFWQRLIYAYSRTVTVAFWDILKQFVPCIKSVHDTKLRHMQTLQLVKFICKELIDIDYLKKAGSYLAPVFLAARSGIYEIVTECTQSIPEALWCCDAGVDKCKNTILHLAAKLAPVSQLNLVSGAALQMQRELQWFKEVEKHVQPTYKRSKNLEGETPRVIFSEEHKDLVKEGEKWMKDTSTACMVVATLVATVVFAAAFTVPGSNNDNGIPIFLRKDSFMIFVISDAVALFFSTASVLMFLSVLTLRYAEEDFLYSLPKRLIIGLTTLFISMTAMLIAFNAALSIVLGEKMSWIATPVALLSCVPMGLFAMLEFPLLVEMVLSTYGPSIFHKQSEVMV